jgi:hypothetical protein
MCFDGNENARGHMLAEQAPFIKVKCLFQCVASFCSHALKRVVNYSAAFRFAAAALLVILGLWSACQHLKQSNHARLAVKSTE